MSAEPIRLNDDANTELPVSEARARLAELVEDVRDGQVIYLTKYGRHVAAVVPADVAENYERMEDAYWSRRAEEALAKNESAVPWHQAISELEAEER